MNGAGNQGHAQGGKENESVKFIPGEVPDFAVMMGEKQGHRSDEGYEKGKEPAIASHLDHSQKLRSPWLKEDRRQASQAHGHQGDPEQEFR